MIVFLPSMMVTRTFKKDFSYNCLFVFYFLPFWVFCLQQVGERFNAVNVIVQRTDYLIFRIYFQLSVNGLVPNMCCDWKASLESIKAGKNWKQVQQASKSWNFRWGCSVFYSQLLGSFCKKIVQPEIKHDDVIETQTRNCVRSHIVHATLMSRHASTHHGI